MPGEAVAKDYPTVGESLRMKPYGLSLLLCCAAAAPSPSAPDLNGLLANAKPGDQVTIPDGTYRDVQVAWDAQGEPANPIVVKPATPGGVIFTGKVSLKMQGAGLVLDGLRLEDFDLTSAVIDLDNASGCRITGLRATRAKGGAAPVIRLSHRSDDNRIDHSEFTHLAGRSIQIRIDSWSYANGPPCRNRIDHNRFADIPPLGGNGRETIQIGQTNQARPLEALTIVEHNLFERCDGEAEIISNKCSANTYRGNLFRECRGELVMRGGSNCVIDGNRFERNKGGIRLHGTGHTVINNVVIGSETAGIRLTYGITADASGLYQMAADNLVAHNTVVDAQVAGIWVGELQDHDRGKDGIMGIAPRANRIVNNVVAGSSGQLIRVDDAPDNTIARNLLWATGDAQTDWPGAEPLLADPRFRGAAAGDYGLLPDSPARIAPLDLNLPGLPDHLGADAGAMEVGPEG